MSMKIFEMSGIAGNILGKLQLVAFSKPEGDERAKCLRFILKDIRAMEKLCEASLAVVEGVAREGEQD